MTASYSGVNVFGDSLVDAGNALKLAQTYDVFPFTALPDGAPTADKGYYNGRFTDGFTFADLLANKYVLKPTKPVFPYGYEDPYLGISLGFFADPTGGNLNFAYGGAQVIRGHDPVPGIEDQTDAWRDAVDGRPDRTALHLFAFGANDVHDLVPKTGAWVDPTAAEAILQQTADKWFGEIRDAIASGAGNILAIGVPDIGVQPYYNDLADEAARRAVATQYAARLETLFEARLPELQALSSGFRFVRFTDIANTVLAEMGLDPTNGMALSRNSEVFFDKVHPTAQLHALAAAYLLDQLDGPAVQGEFQLAAASVDLTVGGNIAVADEVDRLVFSLAANTSYTFEALGISSGKLPGLASWQVLADPSLRLIGPDGLVKAADDDSGLGLDARFQLTTGAAGNYTLEVTGFGGRVGDYRVRADNSTVHDDTYTVTSAATLVIEGPNGGSDQILTSVSYALAPGSSIEALATSSPSGTAALSLTGNEIAQSITGNAGNNLIDGKAGADTLWGGSGSDTFAFTTTLGGGNVDTIRDYNASADTIRLDHNVFVGLALGSLSKSALRIGDPARADPSDRIIYDPGSHALYFDPDGSGPAAATQFAILLGSNLKLTNADFVIV
jgi:Ca2+-binding RTX toxin-like protein